MSFRYQSSSLKQQPSKSKPQPETAGMILSSADLSEEEEEIITTFNEVLVISPKSNNNEWL